MKHKETKILEIVQEAREYERTKSIAVAACACRKLVGWADEMLAGKDGE